MKDKYSYQKSSIFVLKCVRVIGWRETKQ